MGKIFFKNNGISPALQERVKIKALLSSVFKLEGHEFRSVSFIFSRDEYLLALNREYLKHDTFTDIITFTLSGPSTPTTAEIYISIDRVKENAKRFGVGYLNELHRVMIHGVLHLCGYSDHTARLKAQMRKKEDVYLDMLNSL